MSFTGAPTPLHLHFLSLLSFSSDFQAPVPLQLCMQRNPLHYFILSSWHWRFQMVVLGFLWRINTYIKYPILTVAILTNEHVKMGSPNLSSPNHNGSRWSVTHQQSSFHSRAAYSLSLSHTLSHTHRVNYVDTAPPNKMESGGRWFFLAKKNNMDS